MKISLRTTEDWFGTEKYTVIVDPDVPGNLWSCTYWVNQSYYHNERQFDNRPDLLNFACHYIQNACRWYAGSTGFEEVDITFDNHHGDGCLFLN